MFVSQRGHSPQVETHKGLAHAGPGALNLTAQFTPYFHKNLKQNKNSFVSIQ